MLDVAIYDTVSKPQPWTGPLGGTERHWQLIQKGLCAQGVSCEITNDADVCTEARVVIVSRYTTIPETSARVVVQVCDKEPEVHAYQNVGKANRVVFCSKYQKNLFGWRGTVIYPVVDVYAYDVACMRPYLPQGSIYASAPVKGLRATLQECYLNKEKLDIVCSYGWEPAWQRLVDGTPGAKFLGIKDPHGIIDTIAEHNEFKMVNTYAECFPITVYLAQLLGLKMSVRCEGHRSCGITEAMQPGLDLRAEKIIPRWMEVLGL
jgi:hypothetical protein